MKFLFNFIVVGILRFFLPHQCSTSTLLSRQQQTKNNWVNKICRGGQESSADPSSRYNDYQQQQRQPQQHPEGRRRPPPQQPHQPGGGQSEFQSQYDDINAVSNTGFAQQQQQQQRPPPQLPGEEESSSPQVEQQQQRRPPPQLPDDSNNIQSGSTTPTTRVEEPWVDPENQPHPEPKSVTTHHDDSGLDLSQLDKDYILRGLAKLYRKKMLPLELSSKYGHFHSSPLTPSDFEAPPMVLLLGQYSVGKTSFIKYLLGRDFPGIRVGPEPTTDRFTAVLYGPTDKIVPGAALCSQMDKPFRGLSPFGNNFLSRMEGVEIDSPILRDVTLVDTPGILSGHKQRSRNYDYEGVMKWFAERADLIIVMFDAHKLDISDELHSVMNLMIPHLDKLRIVLNKADSVSTQQLMRVYGALMWSLGKVLNTPEVCRVYMGSFWDSPLQNTEQAALLRREERDLLTDIMKLPNQAIMRKINDLVRRARSVKVHAYIIHYLRKQLKYTWHKKDKQKKLVGRLETEMLAAARRYGLPKGDFPPIQPFRQALYEIKDLSDFSKLDKKMVQEMDKVFSQDIPKLLDHAQHSIQKKNY